MREGLEEERLHEFLDMVSWITVIPAVNLFAAPVLLYSGNIGEVLALATDMHVHGQVEGIHVSVAIRTTRTHLFCPGGVVADLELWSAQSDHRFPLTKEQWRLLQSLAPSCP